jgi:glycosyltransferase involved in cell wall biosynthesis
LVTLLEWTMRVLYLETPTGYGGSMQSLLELIEYLPDEIQPVVAVPYDVRQYRTVPDKIRWEIIDAPKPRGFHGYVRLFTHQLGWYRVVRQLMRQHRPDLLHLNTAFMGCFGGAMAAQRAGVPVVAHARGFVYRSRLARKVARFFDYHIAISRAVAENLLYHGVAPERCEVIYGPIVPPRELAGKRVVGDVSRLGMLGMLQEWKGQHVFVEALNVLKQRGMAFHASIAGTEPFGARGYEQRLRQMVRDFSLEEMVSFVGFVSKPYDYLTQLDVAVHASIEPEPLGRVVVEAMLVGTAVVATNGGGIPEFVEHEQTGLLVPMGDAVGMAQAIGRLLKDGELRRRLATAAQQRAREMFNPAKHAWEVARVYRKIVSNVERF